MLQIRLAWIWVKKHWKIAALAVWTLAVWIISRRNSQAALETLAAKKESYEGQIKALQDARDTEVKKREELTLKYKETLAKIEEKYAIKEKELSIKEKKKVKDIIKRAEGNPDEINNKLESLFGFTAAD